MLIHEDADISHLGFNEVSRGKSDTGLDPVSADISRLEWIPAKNTMNMGKNGEKSQWETLKNKFNHTSTRLTNTQDHKVHEQSKGKIQGRVHPKSKGDGVLMI